MEGTSEPNRIMMGVIKRFKSKMRITAWLQVLKILTAVVVLVVLISVYVKGLKQTKHGQTHFNLKRSKKKSGNLLINKTRIKQQIPFSVRGMHEQDWREAEDSAAYRLNQGRKVENNATKRLTQMRNKATNRLNQRGETENNATNRLNQRREVENNATKILTRVKQQIPFSLRGMHEQESQETDDNAAYRLNQRREVENNATKILTRVKQQIPFSLRGMHEQESQETDDNAAYRLNQRREVENNATKRLTRVKQQIPFSLRGMHEQESKETEDNAAYRLNQGREVENNATKRLNQMRNNAANRLNQRGEADRLNQRRETDTNAIKGINQEREAENNATNRMNQRREAENNATNRLILQRSPSTGLNVIIVEEHHEVIPYWFGAADKGLIPKQGNKLIHFDGHNDMAQPFYIPGYPSFKRPSTPNEVRHLMQGNDVFIQASAMAGLIDRVVWVWPTWDKVNHKVDHVMSVLSLGWLQPNKEKVFCMCVKNSTGKECRTFGAFDGYSNNTANYSESEGLSVAPGKCSIVKEIIVEEIVENKAEFYFQSEKWLSRNENVLIDIDEDFFGCSYAVQPLLDHNITLKRIDVIDNIIASIFCPRTLEQEQASDDIMQYILKMIEKIKSCKNSKHAFSTVCKTYRHYNEGALVKHAIRQIEQLIETDLIRVCISNRDELNQIVAKLVLILNNLNSRQLEQFRYVGFCSKTSFKSMVPDKDRHFGVCRGNNSPDNTAVLEHRPTDSEIIQRTVLLQKLLQSLKPFSPRMATVCRSVRDGYTPRNKFVEIEKAVMGALNQTFPASLHVRYDTGLLGGKTGWPTHAFM